MVSLAAAVAALLLLLRVTLSAPIPGLDSFLNQQARLDPQATNDTFLLLPSSLRKPLSLSSSLSPPTPSSLLSLSLSVPLTVTLVGNFPPSSPSLLHSFFSHSLSSSPFHVTHPFPTTSHHISLSHSLHPTVFLSSPSLSSLLNQTLQSQISQTPSSLRSPNTLSIPYSSLDQIIKQHFLDDNHKTPIGFHFYVLNLGPQSKPYAYHFGSGESSPAFTRCPGTVWAGKDRYIWIDLAAGPVDYGPGLSGDGLVPPGPFHPLMTLHGAPKSQKALLADVASLVLSAYQVLLVPSLRIPVPFETSLIVEFVHVYGSKNGNDVGLDFKSIEKTFMDEANEGGLLLGDQTLSFRKYEVDYSDCSICSLAVSRATTSYTSRYLFDNHNLIVSEYLDSKQLHRVLSESAEEFRRAAGLPEEEFGRVIQVYVFDLDYSSVLLLDRYHQSVSFKDMVIAVRTRSTQTMSDYSCNGRHVFTHTRELERPLVGSILQSMWGVSPTHLTWSPTHNDTLVDYTWSVGQTPFGPFSELSSLSFVQKDAAQRNVFLTALNYSISSAIEVLESVAAHGGERKLLKRSQQMEFMQRWNLFKYKVDKSVSALSHLDFEMALYFLRSSDYDMYAIHALVYQASQEIEASLVCFKDPPVPWASVSMSAVVFVAVVYVYVNKDKFFNNKRKQF